MLPIWKQPNEQRGFLCLSCWYKLKLVGNKLNLAFTTYMHMSSLIFQSNKNEFGHFLLMFCNLRNFHEWINHWLYSGDRSCNGYIELSVTLGLVLLLYRFSRQQLYYLLIPNLHQFSLYNVLNLSNLINNQKLFLN